MHLLAAQPGIIEEDGGAVDLGQSPGDVAILSAADTELACLAAAIDRMAHPFTVRLANLTRLFHPMSVDLYTDQVIANAKLVIVRLLGGRSYWPYGLEQVADTCARHGTPLVVLPGDDKPDDDLASFSTVDRRTVERIWTALTLGGIDNAARVLDEAAAILGYPRDHAAGPAPLPKAGLYRSEQAEGGALVVFYRALMLAGDLAPVDALLQALNERGLAARGLYVQSLKDIESARFVEQIVLRQSPEVIVNLTAFAASEPGRGGATPFSGADCPVLQAILSGGSEQSWRDGKAGLGPRDIAMNVALPEVDGRIVTRAISFKSAHRHGPTQCDIARHAPIADRVAFVAQSACSWVALRRTGAADRRVALVLTNYPNRDGRVGNGVGLDTPAATIGILRALAETGYDAPRMPADGDGLIKTVTGAIRIMPIAEYRRAFAALPDAARAAILERWGEPEDDPLFQDGGLRLSVFQLGKVAVGIQPSRGAGLDALKSAHDLTLAPPHSYLAFYFWLRHSFGCHALIHVGKHGNLEWLPGKSVALSDQCFSEVCLGPVPHLYPFIVNDPGEGSQAKRRAQAVIVDHLTPPMTRAETYGPLKDLERLVDEYFDASSLDPRRIPVLRKDILTMIAAMGLDRELGIAPKDSPDAALTKLDAHLCDLKEMQIRDGLHVFGQSPVGEQRIGLLTALARVDRGAGAADKSLHRALAADLNLGFDPLECAMAEPWAGPTPAVLTGEDEKTPWRSVGDTVERLELLARDLVAGIRTPDPSWSATGVVLEEIATRLAPAVDACGAAEMAGLLKGLNGNFVPPGPSGAPTRGRPDALPTGKNFYAVDTRMVPTQAAWSLGWKSAMLLTERHFQDYGEWPRTVALSAWGTSAMRTGGDDIAQALALMGVRPLWDGASGRVTGYEIIPAGLLDRPRVDVTLRISGFFRDAFPALIDLFDAAVRAVAALDEPDDVNPLAARVKADTLKLGAAAGSRIYGSKPGTYGAGLQDKIHHGDWTGRDDLAKAYLHSGGWSYGAGSDGEAAHDSFRERLGAVQAVIHNQDNREHDLLDSDEYYDFEGGLAAAVSMVSGQNPAQWHADHSRPDAPKIYTLQEEIARVVRARAVNPKWIAGMMRHGYKGAAELAATVDYLFAFAATTDAVQDHQFDLVAETYLGDPYVLEFLKTHNPAALDEIKARLKDAIGRGLWTPRKNSLHGLLE